MCIDILKTCSVVRSTPPYFSRYSSSSFGPCHSTAFRDSVDVLVFNFNLPIRDKPAIVGGAALPVKSLG